MLNDPDIGGSRLDLQRRYANGGAQASVDFHADLDTIAAELNGRPRKTLKFMTPSEKFAEAVATTR